MTDARTLDGRYAERRRRGEELMACWEAEDAANVIDLRDQGERLWDLALAAKRSVTR